MEEILRSHRSRLASRGEPVALDDRTWDDLVLDDVYQQIDHTESTLGRHALYHRLRMTHSTESLHAFESLVTRLSTDASSRERAQLALGRLRDVHGYDLWWLARPDAVTVPGWYVAFPILTLAAVALFAGVIVRHDLLPALIAVLVLSFALNIAALKQVGVVSTAFRQIAPLVATGQALRFLEGEDIEPLVAPLRRETGSLLQLKTISRWVSGDPLMLSVQSNLAADDASAVCEITLLRLRALLARARGDNVGYRELVVHYRAMAESLGYEGHIAWAEAMVENRG